MREIKLETENNLWTHSYQMPEGHETCTFLITNCQTFVEEYPAQEFVDSLVDVRLEALSKQKHPYVGLAVLTIKAALKRINPNSYVVIHQEQRGITEETLRAIDMTISNPKLWRGFFSIFKQPFGPTSISSFAKSNVIAKVTDETKVFRLDRGNGLQTIFKTDSSAASRFHTFSKPNSHNSIYTKVGVVLQDPNDPDPRFIGGDALISLKYAEKNEKAVVTTLVHPFENFDWLLEEERQADENEVVYIGEDAFTGPVFIDNVRSAKCTSIVDSGNGILTVKFECKRPFGNARYISACGLKAFSTIHKGIANLGVDMLVGLNSVKGKDNQLRLMAARLIDPNVDITDVDFINSVPLQYTEWEGKKVLLGAAYVYPSELASSYGRVKDTPISFEALRVLNTDANPAARALGAVLEKNYIDADMKAILMELLHIHKDIPAPSELPIYDEETVRKKFKTEDLVLQRVSDFPLPCTLIDPDFNPDGFVIDLSKHKGPVIRIPSAKTLQLGKGKLNNGKYTYHMILVAVSEIIQAILTKRRARIYSNSEEYKDAKYLLYPNYKDTIRSTIYRGGAVTQNLISTLTKPTIKAQSPKMSMDETLPKGVALWPGAKGEYGLVIRNPMLWRNNIQVVRLYDSWENSYKSTRFNTRDKVLTLNHDAVKGIRGDVDGDGVTLIDAKELQPLLKELYETGGLHSVTTDETDWCEEYGKDETEGVFFSGTISPFKLNTMPMSAYQENLLSAAAAKTAVGIATVHMWAFTMLLEAYQAFVKVNGNVIEREGERVLLVPLEKSELELFSFTYIRLIQDKVINGIKHQSFISSKFESFYLDNIGLTKNERQVKMQMKTYNMSDAMIAKFLFIIRFAQYQDNLLAACRDFITLYTDGSFPRKEEPLAHWERFLVDHTYFGSLMRDVYEIEMPKETQEMMDAIFDLSDDADLDDILKALS